MERVLVGGSRRNNPRERFSNCFNLSRCNHILEFIFMTKYDNMFYVSILQHRKAVDDAWMWGFMYGILGACLLASVVFFFGGRFI